MKTRTTSNKQRKKGVSLIVLIITIIVTIILAATVMLSLENTGIIDKANEAVNKSNLQEVKNIASLKWAELYGTNKTNEQMTEEIVEALEKAGADTTKYAVNVTNSGVEVYFTENGVWRQQGLTVTNGKLTLQIGDTIAYDETKAGSITGLTATDWAVLGANEKGELLIMSTSDIVTDYLLGDEDGDNLAEAQRDWLNGAAELDGLCAPYGKGKSATGARSITVKDIDKVVGYNPETDGVSKGYVYEYGNEVIYSYNGTTKPAYVASNGLKGALEDAHDNGFHYYNGSSFQVADLTKTTGTITKLKHDQYGYYAPGIETFNPASKATLMLFGTYDKETNSFDEIIYYYWLASSYIHANINRASFGMPVVEDGMVSSITLWTSNGTSDYSEYGVRAVVSLSTDVKLTGSSTSGWSY